MRLTFKLRIVLVLLLLTPLVACGEPKSVDEDAPELRDRKGGGIPWIQPSHRYVPIGPIPEIHHLSADKWHEAHGHNSSSGSHGGGHGKDKHEKCATLYEACDESSNDPALKCCASDKGNSQPQMVCRQNPTSLTGEHTCNHICDEVDHACLILSEDEDTCCEDSAHPDWLVTCTPLYNDQFTYPHEGACDSFDPSPFPDGGVVGSE